MKLFTSVIADSDCGYRSQHSVGGVKLKKDVAHKRALVVVT